MEIHSLKLHVTELDVNTMLARDNAGGPVHDLAVRFTPEGISIKGKYRAMMMSMPFESLWRVGIDKGTIVAQLTEITVVGLPGAMLKGILIGLLVDSMATAGGVEAQGDVLRIDVDRLLAVHGLPARTNLTGVHWEGTSLIIVSALQA